MTRIAPHQVSNLATAGVLFTYAAAALSDFERETLATVCRRSMERGEETVITEAEWAVCSAAAKAMLNYAVALNEVRYERTDGGGPPPRLVRRGGRT